MKLCENLLGKVVEILIPLDRLLRQIHEIVRKPTGEAKRNSDTLGSVVIKDLCRNRY